MRRTARIAGKGLYIIIDTDNSQSANLFQKFFQSHRCANIPERRFAEIRIGFYERHAAVWKIRFHAAVVDGKYTVRPTAIIRGGTPITATQHSAKDKNNKANRVAARLDSRQIGN